MSLISLYPLEVEIETIQWQEVKLMTLLPYVFLVTSLGFISQILLLALPMMLVLLLRMYLEMEQPVIRNLVSKLMDEYRTLLIICSHECLYAETTSCK